MFHWKSKLFNPAAAPTAIFQSLGHSCVPNQIACFLVCYVWNQCGFCWSVAFQGGDHICSVVSHVGFYVSYVFCFPTVTKHAVCFECHSCQQHAFALNSLPFAGDSKNTGRFSISTDSVSMTLPGHCHSHDAHIQPGSTIYQAPFPSSTIGNEF